MKGCTLAYLQQERERERVCTQTESRDPEDVYQQRSVSEDNSCSTRGIGH